jgi:DNA polymerase-3 subunit delta'
MGSVGKAMQSQEMNLAEAQSRAVEFLQLIMEKKWSKLFRAMDAWFSKELESALFFLDVLAMLVEDLLRKESGAPVRFPSCHNQGLVAFRSDTTSRILVAISQTVRRLEDRKGTVSVALQALALQFGE